MGLIQTIECDKCHRTVTEHMKRSTDKYEKYCGRCRDKYGLPSVNQTEPEVVMWDGEKFTIPKHLAPPDELCDLDNTHEDGEEVKGHGNQTGVLTAREVEQVRRLIGSQKPCEICGGRVVPDPTLKCQDCGCQQMTAIHVEDEVAVIDKVTLEKNLGKTPDLVTDTGAEPPPGWCESFIPRKEFMTQLRDEIEYMERMVDAFVNEPEMQTKLNDTLRGLRMAESLAVEVMG